MHQLYTFVAKRGYRLAFVRAEAVNHIFTSTGDKSVGFPLAGTEM